MCADALIAGAGEGMRYRPGISRINWVSEDLERLQMGQHFHLISRIILSFLHGILLFLYIYSRIAVLLISEIVVSCTVVSISPYRCFVAPSKMSSCTYVILGQTGFASQIANLLIKVVLAFAVVVQRMEMGLKGSSLSSEQQNLQSNTS
ncbi:hypothetical protein QYE76_046968 [Lolium multiflorum]|uniref:Uncharacterized protein n=1 Tax=Lolium multiflorum TaxID=4521 RepID=A0AAD8TN04_LOLMU|nr:hypothetical protein QYE76_046968 [Lolium multiflorum]